MSNFNLAGMVSKILKHFLKTKEELYFRNLSKNVKIGNGFVFQFHPSAQLRVDKDVELRNYVNIWVGKNARLKIDQNVFINNHCSINCLKEIEIGENTLLGEGVKIYDHNHKYSFENDQLKVNRKDFTYGEVKIGKNCWLGSNVVVLKGVKIGDHCIIGAGCVLNKDIPAHSVIVNQQDLISK